MLHIHTEFLNFHVDLDKGRTSKLQEMRSTDQSHGSCRLKYTHTEENLAAVQELTLSRECQPHNRYRRRRVSLSQSSVFVTMCRNLGLQCLKRCLAQELNEANRYAFITADLWSPNSRDLNQVNTSGA